MNTDISMKNNEVFERAKSHVTDSDKATIITLIGKDYEGIDEMKKDVRLMKRVDQLKKVRKRDKDKRPAHLVISLA